MKNALLTLLKTSTPLLVASLDGDDLPYLLEQARTEHADIVEIRLDIWGTFFHDDMVEKLSRFREKIGLPMLLSFRGGHPFPAWWQPMHWRSLAHAAMIDVEWNPKYPWKEIQAQAKKYNVALLISHHDYQRTPTESQLTKLTRLAFAKKADMVKLATRTNSEADLRTLFHVIGRFAPKRLMTVMGMGPFGSLSRLTAPLFQAALVYGYIGTPTANGQLPFRELQDRIRALYPSYDRSLQSRMAKIASVF